MTTLCRMLLRADNAAIVQDLADRSLRGRRRIARWLAWVARSVVTRSAYGNDKLRSSLDADALRLCLYAIVSILHRLLVRQRVSD